MLSVFLESAGLERCGSVRQVFASGEALSFELQQRFFERLGAELHNLYGPTEAAVDVTYWACRPNSKQAIVPIGRPIANTQVYILDTNLQPVPIGVAGELHIGGIGLARGYLNRPDLTGEKFIPDPFSEVPGARLYKTGDLSRFLPDGNIEYLGRIDFQVKLRGFRIELGEIEAVLGECAGVLQAVVVVREDQPGDKRLVAYLLAAPDKALETENLRREIKEKLPEYMVPSRFVVLDNFPMTTSGKVDRKALPAPSLDREVTAQVAPRNETESLLARLFASVLGLQSVGVTDNFFDLGGHSLLAGRLLAQVNEATGKQIPLSAMFRGATVESLAELIEQEPEVGHDPVVLEIQPGNGSRLPFFAIVPPGEESLGYAMLARHMGPEQQVYKIQGRAPVTGGNRPYTEQEMQALASEYIAAMRTVQPHGPYCLGGLCDGTHIAEQIVLRLEEHGEEIGLFAIFDTWVLQHSQIRWLWRVHYYGERLREMKGRDFAQKLASYKRVAENKLQHMVGQKQARTDWRQAYWPEDFTPRRFRAPIVLFKRPKQPFYFVNDRELGWGARTESGVEIYEVDLNHDEILREPHVRVFGEKLSACMERASRRSAETAAASIQNQEATLVGSSEQQRSS
jgi:thioesterase domain-containing protein